MFKTLSGRELYRIGDCIISTNAEDPSKNFGGKWQLLCPGRTLVCIDTSQGEFNTVKKTGGSKTVNLQHSHTTGNFTLTASHIPAHTHNSRSLIGTMEFRRYWASSGDGDIAIIGRKGPTGIVSRGSAAWSGNHAYINASGKGGNNPLTEVLTINATHTHDSVGGGAAHNHGNTGNAGSTAQSVLMPYMAVYIWVRIA